MANRVTTEDRLDGWEAIAAYLGWHLRTVIRWEKQKGLPVHRVAGGKRQPVYAYKHELDDWFQRVGGSRVSASPQTEIPVPHEVVRLTGIPSERQFISRLTILALASVVVLLTLISGLAWRTAIKSSVQITAVRQLTGDGTDKQNLVTDGHQLYFSEEIGDEQVLSTLSADGGSIRQITVPFPDPAAEDISPDGKYLLVVSDADFEDEHPLWIVPTSSGVPRQIPGIACRVASWSPDGKWIAFGSEQAIYLVAPDGENLHKLIQLSGIPSAISWSADERHVRFVLQSLSTGADSLWQVNLAGSLEGKGAEQLRVSGAPCCTGGPLTRGSGSLFFEEASTDHILELHRRPWWRDESLVASALSTQFGEIDGIAASPNSQKLFVLDGTHPHGELVRYDLSTRSFTIMLPGASAIYVDSRPHRDWVAYVKSRDGSLWESRTNETDARQLSPVGMDVQLPRWSPNGQWIAFMGKLPTQPYRIFLVRATGGALKEASRSDDNQGAPTWSPDGKFIIYGNVVCQEAGTCAIHKIDLATGAVSLLPGSQGLGTARWSPDGRHIAALNPVQHELVVYDLGVQRWRTLAEGVNGNDVSWSSDSRYIYTKTSANGPTEIVRVAARGGPVQTVLNLDSFSRSAGQLDTWFSLTPDNALLLNRLLNSAEIYELSYRTR